MSYSFMKSLDLRSNSLFSLPLLKGAKNLPLAPCLHTAHSNKLPSMQVLFSLQFSLFIFYKNAAEERKHHATPVMYDLVSASIR